MASRPADEPPESIVLAAFAGIRNTVSEERLSTADLSAAVNVDIDDAGQLRRRRGFESRSNANYHSLREIAGRHFVVKDGILGTINPALTHTPLVAVGPDPLCYTRVGDVVFFSSRSASGKVVGDVVQPWGVTGGDGQWISPVQTPTETLGLVAGKMLTAPPLATEIDYYKGRIYLAAGRWLWGTELYLYDLVDRTRNFVPFQDDITMLRAVEDGLYVGTTAQLLFLSGVMSDGLKMTVVVDSPVIAGSAVDVPLSKVHPQARQGPVPEGDAPVFLTAAGICLGLDGGQVYNLTDGRVVFPPAQRAAALYREDQGANAYVAVADSGGSPNANARIGDYVDAQIIRASQGG